MEGESQAAETDLAADTDADGHEEGPHAAAATARC